MNEPRRPSGFSNEESAGRMVSLFKVPHRIAPPVAGAGVEEDANATVGDAVPRDEPHPEPGAEQSGGRATA